MRKNVWPGLLGSLGFCLIAGASLRRSYRTTLRFYRGEHQAGPVAKKKVPPQPRKKQRTRPCWKDGSPGFPNRPRRPRWRRALAARAGGEDDAPLDSGLRGHLRFDARRGPTVADARTRSPVRGHGHHCRGDGQSLRRCFKTSSGSIATGSAAWCCPPRADEISCWARTWRFAPLAVGIGGVALVILQLLFPFPSLTSWPHWCRRFRPISLSALSATTRRSSCRRRCGLDPCGPRPPR